MEEKEIEKIKKEILQKVNGKEAEIKDVQYLEQMQLLESNNEYYGLNENDVFLVKKEQERDNKKVITYDIYSKNGVLIGKADEEGNIELTEEYTEFLKEKYKSLYKQLGMDKRKPKIMEINALKKKETEIGKKDNELVEEKEENILEKKEEEKNADKLPKEEKIKKMEEGLGLDPKDIKSSSEIKDQEFYKIVPEAKEYKGNVSIVYIGSTNEFKIVGVDKKTGQYKPLKTVDASRATDIAETKKTIDIGRDGSKVEAQSLKAIINIKGNYEYSFSAKLEGMNPIELKELRRDFHSGEYISADLQTTHQYPVTEKVADMMDKNKNRYVREEVDKYNEEMSKGKEVTRIENIADDKLNVNHGEKTKKQTTERAKGGRTPYDDWAEKHGIE